MLRLICIIYLLLIPIALMMGAAWAWLASQVITSELWAILWGLLGSLGCAVANAFLALGLAGLFAGLLERRNGLQRWPQLPTIEVLPIYQGLDLPAVPLLPKGE